MACLRYLIAMFLLFVMTASAGCAATPQDRWYQQREALSAANEIYLAHVPLMEDQEIVQRGQLLQAARAALTEAHAHLPEGGSAFDSALEVVQAILIQLTSPVASADSTPILDTTTSKESDHDPH
jgi:hypothetical protein